MIVELTRQDLINLASVVAKNTSGDISNHKYKDAFININFVNGQYYKLSNVWVEQASDQLLFDFYKHRYPDIKLM